MKDQITKENIVKSDFPDNTWEALSHKAFIKEWNFLSEKNILDYSYLIMPNFNFVEIKRKIDRDIRTANSKLQMLRYHQRTLNHLSKLFARLLYKESSRGTEINSETISQAIFILRNYRSTRTYPC